MQPSAAAEVLCSLTKTVFSGFQFPFHALGKILLQLVGGRGVRRGKLCLRVVDELHTSSDAVA